MRLHSPSLADWPENAQLYNSLMCEAHVRPERRELQPVAGIGDKPTRVYVGTFKPKDEKDRGNIEFACPGCGYVLLTEMSESFAAVAPPVWRAACERWLSPSGRTNS